MPKTTYVDAPEVREIAERYIEKYHRHLIDMDVRIEYVFVSKTPKRNGKEVWGTCRKISNLNAHLAGQEAPFFVITIAEQVWGVLPQKAREALVDHELCHAESQYNQKEDDDGEDDVIKLSIRPHDVEEFAQIIRRHGLWRDDVKDFVQEALQQREAG